MRLRCQITLITLLLLFPLNGKKGLTKKTIEFVFLVKSLRFVNLTIKNKGGSVKRAMIKSASIIWLQNYPDLTVPNLI